MKLFQTGRRVWCFNCREEEHGLYFNLYRPTDPTWEAPDTLVFMICLKRSEPGSGGRYVGGANTLVFINCFTQYSSAHTVSGSINEQTSRVRGSHALGPSITRAQQHARSRDHYTRPVRQLHDSIRAVEASRGDAAGIGLRALLTTLARRVGLLLAVPFAWRGCRRRSGRGAIRVTECRVCGDGR